jgi:hypothetical protein
MGRNERIGLLVAAVLVLAIGFVFISGGGDEGDGEQQAATRTTAGQPAASEPDGETQPAAPPPPRVERIRIRGGQPVGEARTLKFDSGETVRLRFRSDQASEVHIHGYDKYVNVPAGGTGTARFKANAEGVFEIEEHGTGALLAKLEVSP